LNWYRPSGAGAILQVHAQPGAKRTEVAGLHGDCIKIRLASPPADGKANACLVGFLAACFAVRKNQVKIVQGLAARRKTVLVQGSALNPEMLLAPVSR
jgi:uncharacterized protein (TIGR00251 family)